MKDNKHFATLHSTHRLKLYAHSPQFEYSQFLKETKITL